MSDLVDKLQIELLKLIPTGIITCISGGLLYYSLDAASKGMKLQSIYLGALSLASAFGTGIEYGKLSN